MARPQDKNLIPGAHKLTHEEQSRAGKASGEARRRKKSMKESFEALFAMQACDKYKAAFKKFISRGFSTLNKDREKVWEIILQDY